MSTDVDDADSTPGVGVIVVAAGSGTRLGAAHPKAFVDLAGQPLLAHALGSIHAVESEIAQVVLVVPSGWQERAQEIVDLDYGCPCFEVTIITGGAERSDSVALGIAALDAAISVVLVHDAARALTPGAVFDRVIEAVAGGAPGVIPVLEVVDTIKVVDEQGRVTDSPDRASLRIAQTPQGFRREVLAAAHAAGSGATDDAALVAACGYSIATVAGDEWARKITTSHDLAQAEHLLTKERP